MNDDQKFCSRRTAWPAALVIWLSATIACGLAGGANLETQRPPLTRTRLPTFTVTPVSTPVITAIETGSSSATPQPETLSVIASAPTEVVELPATSVSSPSEPPPPPTGAGQTPEAEETPPPSTLPVPVAPTLDPVEPTTTPVAPAPPARPESPPTASPETSRPSEPSPATTATPTAGSSGWTFINVKDYPNPEEGVLLLYGEVVNDTGSTQIVTLISATFYDSQGQAAADETDTFDYWPVEIVPPGGRLPFELSIYDVQDIADFNLTIEADPDDQVLRQDFDFLDLSQQGEEEDTCVSGKLRNSGQALQEYVVIIATLYDDQDNVINFDNTYDFSTTELVGDQTVDFEICIDARAQEVAAYEVQAWGR